MNWRDAVANACANLMAHELRSLLSMLGMIFGVGAVLAMLAMAGGAERQAMEMIERLGVRNVLVRARELRQEELQEARRKSPGLAPRDAGAIAEAVEGAEAVLPGVDVDAYRVTSATGRTKAKGPDVSHRHAELFGVHCLEGRFFDARDERTYANVCVIGEAARRDLFGFDGAVGRDVKINDLWPAAVDLAARPARPGDLRSRERGGDAELDRRGQPRRRRRRQSLANRPDTPQPRLRSRRDHAAAACPEWCREPEAEARCGRAGHHDGHRRLHRAGVQRVSVP